MIQIFLDCLHLDRKRFPMDALLALDDEQWRELITLAAGHRVTAVFHNRVAAALSDATAPSGSVGTGTNASTRDTSHILPEPFRRAMEELRGYTTRLTRDNLRKQADLQAILRRLGEEGIPVILLKGSWLSHAVYAGLALREMVDVDLMVPAVDLERGAGAVMALGYRPHRTLRDMDTEMRNKHHLPIMQREGAVAVELHWNVTHEGRADFVPPDGFWERSRAIRVAGETARALSPEDMLLHLCLHLANQHMFTFGIRPVLDVALLLQKAGVDADGGRGPVTGRGQVAGREAGAGRRPGTQEPAVGQAGGSAGSAGLAPIDWHALTRRAIDYRWHRGVWITLRLARDLFGAPVPEDALEKLMDEDRVQSKRAVGDVPDGSEMRPGPGPQPGPKSGPQPGPGVELSPEPGAELIPKSGPQPGPGVELVQTAAEQLLALYYARNILSNQMVSMAHKKGVTGKIRHVVRRIFLPRGQMGLLYDIPAGSMKVWFYYPVRIVGLLWRQMGFALGMMRGEKEVMGHVARRERLRQFLQDG